MKKLKDLLKPKSFDDMMFIYLGIVCVVAMIFSAIADEKSIDPKVVSETTYDTSSVIQPVFTSHKEDSNDWKYLVSGLEKVTSKGEFSIVSSFDLVEDELHDWSFSALGSVSKHYLSLYSGNIYLLKKKSDFLSPLVDQLPIVGSLILYNTETKTYSVVKISDSLRESNLDEFTEMYKNDYASYIGLPDVEIERSVSMTVQNMDDGTNILIYKEVYSLLNKEELDNFIKNSPKKEAN